MLGKTSSLIAECPAMVMCSVDTTVHGLRYLLCQIMKQCLDLTRFWKLLWCQSNVHVFKNKFL